MLRMKSGVVAVLALSLAAAVGGCASREPAAPEVPAVAAPADSPFAKITPKMTEVDVRKILGEPTSTRSYMTGKAFIPWYFGTDTTRTAWTYAGQGVVVFSRNQYTGGLGVVRADYNPSVQ